MNTTDFSSIQPYTDQQAVEALARLVANPFFAQVTQRLNPDADIDEVRATILSCQSIQQFHERVVFPYVRFIVKSTMTQLTTSGFEQLNADTQYLFVANHRDITLDAALLDMLLIRYNLPVPEISFGDNLIANSFVADLIKVNRMFPVARGGSRREFFESSMLLSNYIRHVLTRKGRSVWIAQRSGRTKDGNDRTEPGLLKMLSLSSSDDFVASMDQLHIVPLAISYEYEPCADRKVAELSIIQSEGAYHKAPGEDVESVLQGVLQPKGSVHMAVCKPISVEELQAIADQERPEDCKESKANYCYTLLAQLIDQRIHQNYKIHPTNQRAYDIRQGLLPNNDPMFPDPLTLSLYATPVANKLKYEKESQSD